MLTTIVSFFVIFTLLAFAHELGHYIWARRAGIKVYEFGFGFGPRLLAREWSGTIFSINLLPILAFVRIAGEGDSAEDANIPADQLFFNKPLLARAKCLLAGPFMNLGFALCILFVLFSIAGIPSGISNEIGAVNPGSPAEKAGILVGDRLIAINGVKYEQMEKAISQIHQSRNKQLILSLSRQGKPITVKATPKLNQRLNISLLGFSPKPLYVQASIFQAVYKAIEQTISLIILTLVIVWKLITGGVSLGDLAGPVGIAQVTGKYAESGLVSLVYFAAFLNVNIGVLNLLPLPALDGGHLVFIFVEWLRKKPLDRALMEKINSWGMTALLTLMAFVTINDLLRLFGRH
ncbi:RIP metalloprotease RseP [candidate division WOR-1 bacterium RIFOXYB2_FULL_48_7]|uniref:Zinc metalloprotease n=1 Tax=candidate division WOR-1 bacterium RIFOXYB2_FULL_48_7 TaxID=1802583 RepID=A0A1F4TVM8_UNCSA|nr:MAG: RIP metalloprotease RseP [candidate division WOR-1 bacterium RIFOXYB2_FULL_48_7]